MQDENALFKAIHVARIDDLIDDNGLELMKLSMYEELTQNEKDNSKNPSALARHLEKYYDNPQDLQERLIYTLRMLGRRHFGHRAARKLEKLFGSQYHPFDNMVPAKSKIDRRRFLLYQHLVTACRLIPPDSWKGFIHQCAKILKVNERKYKTPCQVLIKLLHENKLTCDNHEDFMEEVMVKAGISESIMDEYENICIKIDSTWCKVYNSYNIYKLLFIL